MELVDFQRVVVLELADFLRGLGDRLAEFRDGFVFVLDLSGELVDLNVFLLLFVG